MKLAFTVFGHAEPQGSARGFIYTDHKTGKQRVAITSDNPKLKQWRLTVATEAKSALFRLRGTRQMIARDIPVNVRAYFYFKAPQSSPIQTGYKTTKTDGDKLLRGILDALSGILYVDDAQVAHGEFEKCFGVPERAEIEVSTLCPTNEPLFPKS